MSAPTFVAGTTKAAVGGSGTGFTINVPTGTVDGDTMFLFVAADPGVTPTATGWTSVTNIAISDSVTPSKVYLYRRTASSEPANYSPSMSSSSTCWGVMLTFRGTFTFGSPVARNNLGSRVAQANGFKTDTRSLAAGPNAQTKSLILYVCGSSQDAWLSDTSGTVTPDAACTLGTAIAFQDAGSGTLQSESFASSWQWVSSAAAEPAVSYGETYTTGPAGNRTTRTFLAEFSGFTAETVIAADFWGWVG